MPTELMDVDGESLFECAVYLPHDFDFARKLPVVLYLHGSGERGVDPYAPLQSVADVFESLQLQAIVVCPQCDFDHRAFYGAMETRALRALDAAVEQYKADGNRQFLLGYSMGASSALYLIARNQGRFNALVGIAPGITWMGEEEPPMLPEEEQPLFDSMFVDDDHMSIIATHINFLPCWFLQGTEDELCPIDDTRQLMDELQKRDANCQLTEYEGVGHDSLMQGLNENGLFEWLLGKQPVV